MTKEQCFFLQVLSDHLNNRITEAPDHPDWTVILQYARIHQISGIVYAQAKAFIPRELIGTFRQDTLATFCIFTSREEILADISGELTAAGIPFFIIKGPMIAAFYPFPALRAMGDIDLVVHAEDRKACHDVLIRKGFSCTAKQEDREWQFFRDSMEIELHDRLVYRETVNEKGHEAYFNQCWEYVRDGRLDEHFHLLFLVFHLRKHLMNSGAGFRQFMDLAVLSQRIPVDWTRFEKMLTETGMLEFARNCYGFLERWFGIHTPLATIPDDDFFESATRKIFADGIFGFDNDENDNNEVINKIRKSRFPLLGKIRIAIRQVFPSCMTLENDPPYTYLKKSRILLPVAWIQRIIRGGIHRKEKTIMNSIRQSFVSNEKTETRREMLRKWGLL